MNLPDKPSELIRLSLADLALCAADPKYRIDMGKWHEPNGHVCEVCQAGAVIAQSLGAPRNASFHPEDFPEFAGKLLALDQLRLGDVSEALEYLGRPLSGDTALDRAITPYNQDPGAFMADMRELAGDLERVGY